MTTKAILTILAGALAAGSLTTARAQETTAQPPLPETQDIAKELKDAAALIPDEAPAVKDAAGAAIERLDAAAAKAQATIEKLNSATLAAREKIALREARSKIVQTPEMQELEGAIDEARTDETKRLARIAYYDALYDRLLKAEPGSKQRIEELRRVDLARQEFVRVRSHEEVAAGR